jgi:hypothetical protein
MKHFYFSLKSSVAILVIAICLFSCSKTAEQANYIPKDANIVMAVDVKSIGIKSLDFKELFSLDNIKKSMGTSSKDSTMEKLKNSGIDLMNTAYFFGQVNEDAKGYGALSVALSDQSKFETFVKSLEQGFTTTKEGDYTFASKAGEKTMIGWNKNSAIFLFIGEGTEANPKEKLVSFFNLKKEESLVENDKNFKDLQKSAADITFYLNMENIGKLAAAYNPTAGAINFKETFLTATCNFEKGQIVINTNYHANKETAEKLSLTKSNLSKDIVSVLPGKSIIAMLGLSLDMDKIYTYLEKEKLTANIDGAAQPTTGLTAQEIFKMLSGEFAATVNGIKMADVKGIDYSTGAEIMRKEPQPEFAVVIGINDKDKAAKVLAKFTENKMLVKKDNYYSFQDVYYIVDKGSYVVITGPESMRQQAIDGSAEKVNDDLKDLLTSNTGTFYFNINNISDDMLSLMGPKAKEYVKNSQLEAITVTSSEMKDNVSAGKVVIAFKQKEENSLITLGKISDKFAEESADTQESTSVMPGMEEAPKEGNEQEVQ